MINCNMDDFIQLVGTVGGLLFALYLGCITVLILFMRGLKKQK